MAGTYTHTTFGEAKDRLATLLGDDQKVFYADAELGQYIIEALRWWGLSAQYFRQSAKFETVAGQAWYDLTTDVESSDGLEQLQSLAVTDREVISDLLYNLMEQQITDWTLGWVGSEQFSLGEITDLLSKSRDDLLKLTGCLIYQDSYVLSGGDSRVQLEDDTIQIVRTTVDEVDSDGPLPMWPADSAQMQATDNAGFPQPGRPKAYVTNYTPTLALDIFPAARSQATLRIDVVRSGAALDPTVSAAPLGFPDDACWALKYRLLDDLVGGDGLGRAPELSQYASQRWQQAVGALAGYQSIVWSSVVGKRVNISSVAQLDAQRPDWEQSSGAPRSIHLLNWNRFAVYPVPDDEYVIELEVVRKAPTPTADDQFIQVGREQMQAIWDYAQHLAMTKCQGVEFGQSVQLYQAAQQAADDWLASRAASSVNWQWQQTLMGQDRAQQRPYRKAARAAGAKEVAQNG